MQVRIRIRRKTSRGLGASSRVGLGILLSRITGLLRETTLAHFLGNSSVAGVFRAAYRIPNMLSVLFGEGVLSAAFITVYAKLRSREEDEAAEHLAAAVFGVLAVIASFMVLVGIVLTPFLIDIIAPGFHGEDRVLAIRLVRILFPGGGLLVMSAWCLGVLNSHRRFLLSYTAPVATNATMIAALLVWGRELPETVVFYFAWASVLGSALSFLVQLPHVLRYLPRFRPTLDVSSEGIRTVARSFGPVFLSRGVVQVSATVDQIISSWLGPIAVNTLGLGQYIAVLPISLFSASISASELPALASAVGTDEEVARVLRERLTAGLRRIAFMVVPCAAAFLFFGDTIAGAILQSGHFHHGDSVLVWSALAGSAVGLLASSLGRLYSSAFYALLDTKTPLRFAVLRVLLTTALGFLFALGIPRALHLDVRWSIGGLTASAGIAGWVEFALLRRGLGERIGRVSLSAAYVARLWVTAAAAGFCGFLVKNTVGHTHPRVTALAVFAVFGIVYFAGTWWLQVEESQRVVGGLLRRLGVQL